jgi:hypothetical protein
MGEMAVFLTALQHRWGADTVEKLCTHLGIKGGLLLWNEAMLLDVLEKVIQRMEQEGV